MPRRGDDIVGLAFAIGVAGVLVGLGLAYWVHSLSVSGNFGTDLVAYAAAADRFVGSGTPYHPRLFTGPIENITANIPIGYLYPPPLAQLFVVLHALPLATIAIVWAVAQAVLFAALLPCVFRWAGGRLTPFNVVLIFALAGGGLGLQEALTIGNVSGWIGLAVGWMLIAPPRVQALLAVLVTAVKALTAPMLGIALIARATRWPAVVISVGFGIVSVALAPRAWADWIAVLPNLLQMPISRFATNVSPAAALSSLGFDQVGAAVGWVLTTVFGMLAIRRARGARLRPEAIAAATLSYLFLSRTLWRHYDAVLYPLVVATWPRSGPLRRLAFVTFVIGETRLLDLAGLQLGLMSEALGIVIAAVALAAGPIGPRSLESAQPIEATSASIPRGSLDPA